MLFLRAPALQRHDRGAALVTALLVLTVMTLLALGASQLRHAQGSASRTMQQRDVALQSAEAALRGAERLLVQADGFIGGSCTIPRCRVYARDQLGNPWDHRAAEPGYKKSRRNTRCAFRSVPRKGKES